MALHAQDLASPSVRMTWPFGWTRRGPHITWRGWQHATDAHGVALHYCNYFLLPEPHLGHSARRCSGGFWAILLIQEIFESSRGLYSCVIPPIGGTWKCQSNRLHGVVGDSAGRLRAGPPKRLGGRLASQEGPQQSQCPGDSGSVCRCIEIGKTPQW